MVAIVNDPFNDDSVVVIAVAVVHDLVGNYVDIASYPWVFPYLIVLEFIFLGIFSRLFFGLEILAPVGEVCLDVVIILVKFDKLVLTEEIALPCRSLIVLPPRIADIEEAFIYARSFVSLVFWNVSEVSGGVCSSV